MEKYNETGQVICQECGKAFNIISPTHLKKSHKMTLDEYRKRYDNFPVASKSFGAKQKYHESQMFEENSNTEIQIEPLTDFDLDKIPNINKDFSKNVSSFIDEVKQFSDGSSGSKQKFLGHNIHKNKLKILNFLVIYFPELKNSYFIEKTNIAGALQYRLITDMCCTLSKVDFEFPDVFWHNKDPLSKEVRDNKLKADGWTVVNVPGTNPTTEQLQSILKKNNLI
jgi:hypothetical protein